MNVEKFEHMSEDVVRALRQGRIGFSLQQINAIDDTDEVLYYECLGRLVQSDGAIRTAGEFLPCLDVGERSTALDRHIVGLAFNWLSRNSSGALGCNISAESISDARSWRMLYDLLSRHQAYAPRLVLEITETLPAALLSLAGEMIQSARDLGYRIAADDFGAGYSTAQALISIPVDIVKIDAFFIQHPHARSNGILKRIVDLAACVAPTIIVEGVETNMHLEIARTAGATHAQGYLLSEPKLTPIYFGKVNLQQTISVKKVGNRGLNGTLRGPRRSIG